MKHKANKVSLFLKQKVIPDIEKSIEDGDNFAIIQNLGLLKEVATSVPKETFHVVSSIIRGKEKPAIKGQLPPIYVRKNRIDVLLECVRVLDIIKYYLFDETIDILVELYAYQNKEDDYKRLREKILSAISSIARYDPYIMRQVGYGVQLRLFGKMEILTEKDKIKYLPIILKISDEILDIGFESLYSSPVEPEKVTLSWGALQVTNDLRNIRENVISLLIEIYQEIADINDKIQCLKILDKALKYPAKGKYGEDLERLIRRDTEKIIGFYLSRLQKEKDLLILEEIWGQALFVKKVHEDAISKNNELISKLKENELYNLHRLLAIPGWQYDEESIKGRDWGTRQKNHEKEIKDIAKKFINGEIQRPFEKLNTIAETAEYKDFSHFTYFRELLFKLGCENPDYAKWLIKKSIYKDCSLKIFVGELVRGLRVSEQGTADRYVEEWIYSKDDVLYGQVIGTFYVEDKYLKMEDINFIEKLEKFEDKKIDQQITWFISRFYPFEPKKCSETLIRIAARGDKDVLKGIAMNIFVGPLKKDSYIKKWSKKRFSELIWNYIRVPRLDWTDLAALAVYGQEYPIELINFFNERIKNQINIGGSLKDYDAIPFELGNVDEMLQNHSKYSQVIEKILHWIMREEWFYQWEGKRFLTALSPELDKILESKLKGYILSGNVKKMKAATRVLDGYKGKPFIYPLCKEVIRKSKGNKGIVRDVAIAISQTGTFWGEDGLIKINEKKIKLLNKWLKDKNIYVREFAKKLIDKLKQRSEIEKQNIDARRKT